MSYNPNSSTLESKTFSYGVVRCLVAQYDSATYCPRLTYTASLSAILLHWMSYAVLRSCT